MTRTPQLRLVQDAPPAHGHTHDPVRRVFEHWAALLARNPRRCKLDPARAAAVRAALEMGHDEDTLLAAVEGMAADPLQGCTDRMRDAMRELPWLLAESARIERWAELGDQLRAAAEQDAPAPAAADTPEDPAAVQARREKLRALAERSRQGARLWR